MILETRKSGKITLVIEADKKSKYYLTTSGDIKQVDQDYILNELSLLKSAKTKKSGVHTIQLRAISDRQKNGIIKRDNQWVNRNQKPIKSGGLFTMLSNKGY